MSHLYPRDLQQMISFLKKLPGVGSKTAERFAFQLLRWKENELENLGRIISNIKKNINYCKNRLCQRRMKNKNK